MRRVLVLGRGGAGKSVLARQLGELTGLPVTELDTLFWQPGLTAPDAAWWVARQDELVQRDAWILDGDLGPYDRALDVRLRAADTIIMLNFTFLRCAWRTVLRSRERSDYWCWVWSYRRQSLPRIMLAIRQDAPHATLCVLRRPDMARRLLAEVGREIGIAAAGNAGDPTSSLAGMRPDRLHLHQSRSEREPGCPQVTVRIPDRPPHRARGGHDPVIRRLRRTVQDRPAASTCWADIPGLSSRVGSWLQPWQQFWQQSAACLASNAVTGA